MFKRRFAVSVLLSMLSGCGADDPSKSSGTKGRSGDAGTTDARTEERDAAVSGTRDAAADSGDRTPDAMSGNAEDCTSVELTYSDFAAPFFSSHCGRCHGAGDDVPKSMRPPPDITFKTEADVIRLRDRIRKAAVELRRMPPGEPLSDCKADQLSKYLDTLPGPKAMDPEPMDMKPMDMKPMTCAPKCDGKQCGDDGCGATCGTCPTDRTCDSNGACICVPNCEGKQCGSDGCGGSCGECTGSMVCDTNAGMCQATCTPDCTGKVCGDDGCGGSCGSCSNDQTCTAGQCVCAPNCIGRQCGADGCGSTCGTCPTGQACGATGICAAAPVDFEDDVYPIFAAAGCGSSNCHGGSDPAQGMNLSSASNALAALVGVPANECSSRMRVAPGAPGSSYLINKLTGQDMCAGERMPRGGAALSQSQVDTIRAWISGL